MIDPKKLEKNVALRLLRSFCPPQLLEEIEGDLLQRYEQDLRPADCSKRSEENLKKRAQLKLIWNVIRYFRPGIIMRNQFSKRFTNSIMFKNYFIVAWRSFLKKKAFSLINILGISLGISFALLAILFIQDEFSFDRFHENKDLIYRVENFKIRNGKPEEERSLMFPLPFAPTLKANVPGIDFITRHDDRAAYVSGNKKQFKETIYYVDADFFKMLSLTFIQGNKDSQLTEPSQVVISKSEALKLFETENVVGKPIEVDKKPYIISGVFKDFPLNSSFAGNLYLRYEEFPPYAKQHDDWGASYSPVFLQLNPLTDPSSLSKPFEAYSINYFSKGDPKKLRVGLSLNPFTKIHFDSQVWWTRVSDIKYSYILGSIALVVLLVASMNYILLSLSGSLSRAKEIGVRKVIGATRNMIRLQFFAESLVIVCFALPISLLLLQFVLPEFNSFMDRKLELFEGMGAWLGYLIILVLFTSLGAGGYPALVLSRLKPERILKSNASGNYKGKFMNFLIVFQFVICFVLLTSAYIMFDQLRMMTTRNLGFSKNNVLIIDMDNNLNVKGKKILQNFRSELGNDKDFLSFSAIPADFGSLQATLSSTDSTGKTTTEYYNSVDFDFFEMLEIPLIEGRFFSKDIPADTLNRYVVNETYAKQMGGGPVAGRQIPHSGGREIIGVVKDFNFQSLTNNVKPFAFSIGKYYSQMLVKVRPDDIPSTIAKLENCWNKVVGDGKLKFSFLDDHIAKQYQRYVQWSRIVSISSFLAISIALLGLLGIINLTVINRTKEIGIRKVLGATVLSIISLFSKRYVVLIMIGFVLAMPISHYMLSRWLENFAYKTLIGYEHFAIPLAIILLVASAVMVAQIFKKAVVNPVESIRYE